MICEVCQLESSRGDLFKVYPHLFRSQSLNLCLSCYADKNDQVSVVMFWLFLASLPFSLGLALYLPTHIMGIGFANISVFQISLLVSTVLHELGHVAIGKLAGFRMFSIDIGRGRVLYDFRVWFLQCRVRSIPFGGLAHGAAMSGRFFKIRRFLMVLGGPMANAILLAGAVMLLPIDERLAMSVFHGFVPVLIFGLANAFLLAVSLWPYDFDSAAGKLSSDGKLVWKIWWAGKAEIDQHLAARYWMEAVECAVEKDAAGMRKWIDAGLRLFPNNLLLKISQPGILYIEGRYSDAMRSYALLLGRFKKQGLPDMDWHLLNSIASCCILSRRQDLLGRAEICSRAASKKNPLSPYCRGTRGSVLVETGQIDAGLKELLYAFQNVPGRVGRALTACYIGIAEAKKGNPAASRHYFDTARKLDSKCVLLDRGSAP